MDFILENINANLNDSYYIINYEYEENEIYVTFINEHGEFDMETFTISEIWDFLGVSLNNYQNDAVYTWPNRKLALAYKFMYYFIHEDYIMSNTKQLIINKLMQYVDE